MKTSSFSAPLLAALGDPARNMDRIVVLNCTAYATDGHRSHVEPTTLTDGAYWSDGSYIRDGVSATYDGSAARAKTVRDLFKAPQIEVDLDSTALRRLVARIPRGAQCFVALNHGLDYNPKLRDDQRVDRLLPFARLSYRLPKAKERDAGTNCVHFRFACEEHKPKDGDDPLVFVDLAYLLEGIEHAGYCCKIGTVDDPIRLAGVTGKQALIMPVRA